MLPAFQWLGQFDPVRSVGPWIAAAAFAFVISALLLFFAHRGQLQKRQIVWMLLAPAIFNTLWLRQDYSFLLLLSALAWYFYTRGMEDAGAICMGLLCATKPNLLVFPLLCFIAGHRRNAILTSLTTLAASLLPIAIYGPQIYPQWFGAISLTDHSVFPADVSLAGFVGRMGHRSIGTALAVTVLLFLCRLAFTRQPSPLQIGGMALCAGILCSPLGWFQYSILIIPWFTADRWGAEETLAALLLMTPTVVPIALTVQDPALLTLGGLPYFSAITLMQAIFVTRVTKKRALIEGRAIIAPMHFSNPID